MSLRIGDRLPGFTLKDQDGNDYHSLDRGGDQPLVLFFYPKDFTPGCTKEACSFRDHFEDFTDNGAEVVGISSDSIGMHKKFATRHNLPFTLLSDPKGKVRRQFGIRNAFLNLLPGRETFVFDKEGELVLRYRNSLATEHMERALKAVQELV